MPFEIKIGNTNVIVYLENNIINSLGDIPVLILRLDTSEKTVNFFLMTQPVLVLCLSN